MPRTSRFPVLLSGARAGAGAMAVLAMQVAEVPAQTSRTEVKPGIYSCTDASGRRITSDRPITQCLDREQRELGSSGTVKRVIPPSYTADERARIEAEKRKEAEAQARIADEKRRDKALFMRYPNKAAHDRERAEALTQIDEVIAAVNKRAEALNQQRREIDTELEFYQNDPKKAPEWLRRKLEDNDHEQKTQQRFLFAQVEEKARVNARFDEELARLRRLWAEHGVSGGSGNAATAVTRP
ncbi:DUF4124 domain-containing protein [Hydrogenophaga bisanensis]|uniref:DUF4124 domain-containing protein n=1 Tax=Hydrogenophaga bisanensis TaxID=439611 RepID=A0ABW2RCQ6_9BURK|nr:DUF4124 domain-containing protein [Hydrogenophaga sp.]